MLAAALWGAMAAWRLLSPNGSAVAQVVQEPTTTPAAGGPVDEATARAYNRFRQQVAKRLSSGVDEVRRALSLDEEQAAAAGALAEKMADGFMQDNGQKVFDVFQRVQALQRFMQEAKVGWQDVPADIKQDLARRALPMVDALAGQVGQFADKLNESLNPQQQEQLAVQRRKLETAFWMVRAQARLLGGQVADGQGAGAPDGSPPAAAGGVYAPGAGRAGSPLDAWEKYVESFIQRYRLDEVQKLRARDLLAEHKAKADRLLKQVAASQPTEPASAPAGSLEALKAHLERARQQHKPVAELFEQFKAELDKIPAPAQRRAAGEDPDRPPERGAPSTGAAPTG